MRRGIRILLLIAGWLALTGCRTMTTTSELQTLDGTSWTLSSLPSIDVPSALTVPAAARDASARFENGRIAGSDGCNRYSAVYTTTGSTIEIDPRMVSTRMACPPDVMERANAFTSALAEARRFRIEADRLELRSETHDLLVTFVRDGDRSAAIDEAEARFRSAIAGDPEALESLLADDFFYLTAEGTMLDKRGLIDHLRSGTTRIDRIVKEDGHQVRRDGLVVTTGHSVVEVRLDGNATRIRSRHLHVWIEEAGGWRLLARQADMQRLNPS